MSTNYMGNMVRISQYGSKKYKLTNFRTLRRRSEGDPQEDGKEQKAITKKGEAGNNEKLLNNLSRARSVVFQLAMCNPWDLFVTLTLDEKKYNRHDLPKFKKDLSQLVRDLRKKYSCDIKYLLIPEQHKDGCWHMHGFIYGLPEQELKQFTLNDHLPTKILSRIEQGKKVYTWTTYARKFGFADIEKIENNEAASKYMTKYVTKDTMRTIKELNAHIFYASNGLNRAEVVYQGAMEKELEDPDFVCDWVMVKWFSIFEEALKSVVFCGEGGFDDSSGVFDTVDAGARSSLATVNL